MFNRKESPAAELPVEDGVVSAQTLTLDKESAAKRYETITFGLG